MGILIAGILLGLFPFPSPFPFAFPPFPLPFSSFFILFSLFLLLLSPSFLQMHLLWETEKRCRSGLCFGETVEAVVSACIASWCLCFQSGIYLCEQKTKLLLLLLFFPKGSFFSVSLITFWMWVLPSTLLRKIADLPSAPTQPRLRVSVRNPRGIWNGCWMSRGLTALWFLSPKRGVCLAVHSRQGERQEEDRKQESQALH